MELNVVERKKPNITIPIKEWAHEDQPREKLLLKGKISLSSAELIAILLRSGSSTVNAVELAKEILQLVDNNIHALANLSAEDFMRIKGIGKAKAMSLVAAFELGRRRIDYDTDTRLKIEGSQQAYALLRPNLADLPHEEFWVILLNRANRALKKCQIGQGGITGTVADPKVIFKAAVDGRACSIIVAHNHPSGNLTPSKADLDLTQKLKAGGQLLDIQVLDHLIFAGQKYYSFADEGLM
ncbi:RadC family protein [Chryseolinea lacunae]|uniref:DNA repair protein RadC n=1 Tax=Chryseolinea lacunae TaxID=2801331 RepID=A0ABS1L0D8_9BACT|nr:DNA repair protein RadC [Chryseolinea lacunae]MBL0745171.1 DNA repair protein RadC [Chryseolinea lacunae]